MIRPATGDDLDALAGLEAELFGADAWSADSVASELCAAGRLVTVAEQDGRVVAYAITILAGDVADLARIGVRPGAQRSGIGRALLGHAVGAARTAGADRMLLEVSGANAAALGLYARAGFTQVDVRPGYYRDSSDALILRLPLGADSSLETT